MLAAGELALLVPIVAIVGTFASLIARRWMRHRERMAMIEMGMHPDHPEAESDELDEPRR